MNRYNFLLLKERPHIKYMVAQSRARFTYLHAYTNGMDKCLKKVEEKFEKERIEFGAEEIEAFPEPPNGIYYGYLCIFWATT